MSKKLYLLGACLLAFALSWLIRPDLAGHGLRALYNPSGVDRVERIALLTSNDWSVYPDSPLAVRWTGYVYFPDADEVTFRIATGLRAKLTLNGDVVFDTFTGPAAAGRAVAHPIGGFNAVTLEAARDLDHDRYFQGGLEWQTPFGWQIVPASYLYPEPAGHPLADSVLRRALWSHRLAWLGGLLGGALIGAWLWAHRRKLNSRVAAGLALVVALAFVLRLGFLRDYAAQPWADVLGDGSDHRGYQASALDFLRGHWPPASPFYIQPGMSLFLGGVYSVAGPNIRTVQILQMALGALVCLMVFDIARRLFDDWAGWAAALLWAVFPLPIFYEAQLLTHGLEPALGAALLFLWARSLTVRESTWQSIAWLAGLGLTLGVSAVLRPTFLVLAPFAALTLFLRCIPHWRRMIGRPALLACLTLLPILPVTWHNFQAGGRFQLLTSNSDITLYLGNNRDSTGLGEYSPAYWATHTLVNQGKTTFFKQTLADVGAGPMRWVQLMVRKAALYAGNPELPNNVDFYTEGVAISPLLAALPLRFGALMALAFAGTALAWPYRQGRSILLIYLVSQIAVTVLYHVFSRFRAPVYPALAILGGYAITTAFSALRGRRWRGLGAALSVLAVSGLAIAAMPLAAESVMTRPIVSSLPATARPLNTPLGQSLTLVGYEPLPAVAPGDPFFVTLYWQSSERLSTEIFSTVQLFGGDLKVTQADQAIGTGSFPDYATTEWKPGQIVRDTVFLRMPEDAPAPLSLTVLVAAYDRASGRRFGETTFGYQSLTRAEAVSIPPEAHEITATVGTASLNAYAIRGRTLTLYWQAGAPMTQDAVVFVHLFDPNGSFIAGVDSRPRMGSYATPAWQPGEGIVDDHPLPPDLPAGDYEVRVGMYDAATHNRLAVMNALGESLPDSALPLGTITIK